MRFLTLVLVLLTAHLVAHAAPRKATRKTHPARPQAKPLSPDKLRGQIAYVQNADLWVIDPDTLRKHLLFSHDVTTRITPRAPGLTYLASDFALSPDLKSLIVNVRPSVWQVEPLSENDRRNARQGGSVLYVFTFDGKPARALTSDDYQTKNNPRWSPDGKHIAYNQVGYNNYVPDTESAQEVHIVDVDGSHGHRVAGTIEADGSPDGYFASDVFWSLDSKRVMFTLSPSGTQTVPDSPQTLTAALDGSNRQPFDGNWSDFDLPDVARDARLRARPANRVEGGTGCVNLLQFDPAASKADVVATFLEETEGFSLSAPICPDATARRIVFQGRVFSATVNAQGGVKTSSSLSGIFLSVKGSGKVRLLVANATLVGWL